MKLSLGALQYYWPRQTIFDFYEALAASPVDIVYLGETVCSRRHELRFSDWIDIADLMRDAKLRSQIKLENYVTADVGLPTLTDIMAELATFLGDSVSVNTVLNAVDSDHIRSLF